MQEILRAKRISDNLVIFPEKVLGKGLTCKVYEGEITIQSKSTLVAVKIVKKSFLR